MKYILAMFHIWKNMVENRSPRALIALTIIGIVAIITSLNCYLQHPNKLGIAGCVFSIIVWTIGFPCAVFLIDMSNKGHTRQKDSSSKKNH